MQMINEVNQNSNISLPFSPLQLYNNCINLHGKLLVFWSGWSLALHPQTLPHSSHVLVNRGIFLSLESQEDSKKPA